jgi:RNA ligase
MYKNENVFGVCSRNLDLIEDENNAMWKLARKLEVEQKLPNNYAIQGEIYGEGIQKNPHKINDQKLAIFNVYDILGAKFLDTQEAREFCINRNWDFVEEYKRLTSLPSLEELIKLADSTNLEGLVFRPIKEIRDKNFGRLSFKVISPEYLIRTKG